MVGRLASVRCTHCGGSCPLSQGPRVTTNHQRLASLLRTLSSLSLSLSLFVATWLSNNLGMSVKQAAAIVAPWPAFTSLCKVALVRTLEDTHEFKLKIWLHYKSFLKSGRRTQRDQRAGRATCNIANIFTSSIISLPVMNQNIHF